MADGAPTSTLEQRSAIGMGISLRNFLHLVEVNMFEKITLKQMVSNALQGEEVSVLQSQDEMF
jgi:hypothetical protein